MYHQSPRGRRIIRLVGDPDEIMARGTEIELLGGQMRDAADVLKDIKTRADDQQGKAIESLRETIGDSYETLYEAADLYEPVGPVIHKYGSELDGVQTSINNHADRCRELWTAYYNAPGTIHPDAPEPEEGSEEESDNQAKQAAYDAWKEEADLFDSDYDTWETAFDEAVNNITDEMSGAIEDGFWRSFLDIAGKVLGWAGLILGIAALIVTGPIAGIIAAAAAVVGVLALLVTIAQMGMGDAGWGDFAWAVVGILPIGKLGKLFKGGEGMLSFADDFAKQFKPSANIATESVYTMFKNGNASDAILKLMTGETSEGWDEAADLYQTVPDGQRLFRSNVLLGAGNQYKGYEGWYSTLGGPFAHIPESDSAAERVKALQGQQ